MGARAVIERTAEHVCESPEQTQRWAAAVARVCEAGDVIALEGELGAGKTQFVRGLAVGLGIDSAAVSSPTFVLMQEYELWERQEADGPALVGRADVAIEALIHIDAYRLGSADAMASIGWEEEGEELRAGAVVAIEWASLVRGALGEDVLTVELEHTAEGRLMKLTPSGSWVDRIARLGAADFS